VICLLLPFLAWLGFGKQGLVSLYRTEIERQACIERIRTLVEENNALIEEISRLRTDMKHVESIARREFNLIKKNEVIYRFREQGVKDMGQSELKREKDSPGWEREGENVEKDG
jgi:cell division protein FtsB